VHFHLSNGSRVCIVGGGPAGNFAALHLLSLARQRDLDLEVLIFEPRDFSKPGPSGCNRCAGILSASLLQGLDSLGIQLPDQVIQANIHSYAVHLPGGVLPIHQPNPTRRIISVYRGGGPRAAEAPPAASFDAFLLSQASSRGASHIRTLVRRVLPGSKPTVETPQGSFRADLVVLATGINSRAPLDPCFGYQTPKSEVMAQDEVLRPSDWPADQVQTYFQDPPGLIFGALIPKGRYLNISLLGRRLEDDAVGRFMQAHSLGGNAGPRFESLCGCRPKVAVGAAPRAYGDRWVAVGDASVTRLYKDGIGSAFHTAQAAMSAAIELGVSDSAFRHGYARVCRAIRRDNRYGRWLFGLWSLTLRFPALLEAWAEAIRLEESWPAQERYHGRVLWGMFTGDEPYEQLARLIFHPRALWALEQGYRQRRG